MYSRTRKLAVCAASNVLASFLVRATPPFSIAITVTDALLMAQYGLGESLLKLVDCDDTRPQDNRSITEQLHDRGLDPALAWTTVEDHGHGVAESVGNMFYAVVGLT